MDGLVIAGIAVLAICGWLMLFDPEMFNRRKR